MKSRQSLKTPQKKIILIRNAYSYDFGGAERFPINLSLELHKHGYQPTIVSNSQKLLTVARQDKLTAMKGLWWSRQNWSGFRVVFFPAYLAWQALLLVWYLRLFLKLQPQIVHPQSKDDFIASTFAAKLLRRKVVWTDHADLKYVFANHKIWYKNPVGKLVYMASMLADEITLVSHDEARSIEKELGQSLGSKYRVIHNGVREVAVKAIARPKNQKNRPVYCSTSRLVTAKGIGELIEAFKKVKQKNPSSLLWLVGDGPEDKKFEAQARTVEGIEFIGYSDNPLGYVAAGDIFVHPSYHEGLSLSLVEAAMLSRPIIACNVGGNPEIIKNNLNGLLVPARDSGTLASAMLKLVDDSNLRKSLGEAARATYEKSFRFSTIVKDQFLPLYEEK